jgi:pimeloyl-ACP methyl ester carboxylesterase
MGILFSKIDTQVNQLMFMPPEISPSYIDLIKNLPGDFVNVSNQVSCLCIKPLLYASVTKCIVFSHGNGTDIYHMHEYLTFLANRLGIDVYIYDYYGYGLSPGNPTEKGCYESFKNVMDFVRQKYEDQDIILIGHSLGTGVVMDYVANYNWLNNIILISPYKSMGRVVMDSCACGVVKSIDKFGTFYKLQDVNCPVKIFHGTADKLIKITHAFDLYENLNNKSLKPVWLVGIDHNNILEAIDLKDIKDVVFSN